jgi:DNA polymerase-4
MLARRVTREKKATHPVPPRLPRRIAHVDLDTFFVSVELVRDPSLRGKPVLVGGAGGRGVVASASYESRRFGCHSAQPMAQALRLCPQAVVVPPHFECYREASDAFHAILRDCSPLVESAGLDEAYVDLTGSADPARDATDGERAVLDAACARVRAEVHIPVSACVADSRTTAKVGSDRAKPDGLIAVEPGGDAAFLAPFPVRELPMVGPRMGEELAAGGVHTIGELAALGRRWLAARFGRVGELVHDRAQGRDPAPVHGGRRPARSISREVTFGVDVLDRAELRRVLARHAERVAGDLRVAGRSARTVTLKLRWDDFRTVTRSRTLARPTHATRTLAVAGAELLDGVLAQQGRRRVRLIGLAASNLVGDELQLGFDDAAPATAGGGAQREEQLDRALDAIRSRHGAAAVTRGPRRDPR